jgi:hypothetical protein
LTVDAVTNPPLRPHPAARGRRADRSAAPLESACARSTRSPVPPRSSLFARLMAARGVWALADQGVCSLGNFLTGVLMARGLADPHLFGVYSLALSVLMFLNSLHGSVVTYPLTLEGAAADPARFRRLVRRGLAFTLSVAPVLAVALVAATARVERLSLLPWAALAMVMWQAQETVRGRCCAGSGTGTRSRATPSASSGRPPASGPVPVRRAVPGVGDGVRRGHQRAGGRDPVRPDPTARPRRPRRGPTGGDVRRRRRGRPPRSPRTRPGGGGPAGGCSSPASSTSAPST